MTLSPQPPPGDARAPDPPRTWWHPIADRIARLTAPHPSVVERREQRVLRLIAAWHLVGVPVGPLIALHLAWIGRFDSIHVSWLAGSQLITVGGYFASRSRYGTASLRFQIGFLVVLIGAVCWSLPESAPAMMALLLPVLTAGICLRFTDVVITQIVVLVFIFAKSALTDGLDSGVVGGLLGVLFSGFVLSAALVWQRDGMVRDELDASRKRDARARALLDAAFDGTAVVRDGRYAEVSEGFSAALGMPTDQLVGRELSDATPFRGGAEGVESAVPLLDASGSLRYLDVVRQPVGEPRDRVVVVAIRDVTRNTLHRSNLQFVDRMTALGTLTAGVAHEVNNALHSVLGQVEISTLFLGRGDLERVERSLALIDRGGQRISDCVRRLQRFSATPDTTPGAVDVGMVVRSTVALASHRIRHAARVEIDIEDDLVPASCVESHVSQVVMNLLLNAADAAESSADPRILVQVRSALDGASVELQVSDSGEGVSVEAADRIFQPFYSTKQAGKGSGLGLAISASIAAQMGGTLTLATGPLSGASFVLRIPAATEPDDPSVNRIVQPLSPEELVLIVDDEPELGEVMAAHLAPATVRCVTSAEAARLAWTTDYNWVISDIVMPGESGLDLRAWVAKRHPEMLGRFLLMTGSAIHLEDEVAQLPDEQVVLRKPLGRDALLLELARVRRRAAREA